MDNNIFKKLSFIICPSLFLIFGILILFYPMIINTNVMAGDLGDARLVNYILEHFYLFFNHNQLHGSFWDMPFFYPNKNTLAMSDVLLGGALIYIPIRTYIQNAQTALQLWIIIVCILNFFSYYLLSKKCFKFNNLIASFISFIFAFGLIRASQMLHLQLIIQFYLIFSIYFLSSVKKENSNAKNISIFFLSTLFFVIQTYTTFYIAWFSVFAVILFLFLSLFFKKIRIKVFDFIKRYFHFLVASFIFGIILLTPLTMHYLAIDSTQIWSDEYLLKLSSFIASNSILNTFITKNDIIIQNNCETIVGFGIVTSIFILCGIYKNKYRKFIIIFLLFYISFFSFKFLNHILYNYFPAAYVIRAAGRCVLVLLIFFPYFLGEFLNKVKKPYLIWLCIIFIVIEQISYGENFAWDKIEHTKRIASYHFPKECKVVYLTTPLSGYIKCILNIDIMWYASENNFYTNNGYSGIEPKILNKDIDKSCTITPIYVYTN